MSVDTRRETVDRLCCRICDCDVCDDGMQMEAVDLLRALLTERDEAVRRMDAFYKDAERAEQERDEAIRQREATEQKAAALVDWQATVTAALRREGGAFYADVPTHIRELVARAATAEARVQELEEKLADARTWQNRNAAAAVTLAEMHGVKMEIPRDVQS